MPVHVLKAGVSAWLLQQFNLDCLPFRMEITRLRGASNRPIPVVRVSCVSFNAVEVDVDPSTIVIVYLPERSRALAPILLDRQTTKRAGRRDGGGRRLWRTLQVS